MKFTKEEIKFLIVFLKAGYEAGTQELKKEDPRLIKIKEFAEGILTKLETMLKEAATDG